MEPPTAPVIREPSRAAEPRDHRVPRDPHARPGAGSPDSPPATSLLRHQQLDDLCAAVIRAVSGVADISYRDHGAYRGPARLAIRALHLRALPGVDSARSSRAIADGTALRIRWSDLALHERLCPTDPVERAVFDLLEQYRVESLANPTMTGLVENLAQHHRAWSLAFHHSGLTQTEPGLLLYTLAQVCRMRITGERVLHETEGLIESSRFALAPIIGDDLAGLRRHRAEQEPYAKHALAIARTMGEVLRALRPLDGDDEARQDARSTPAMFTLWDDDDTRNVGSTEDLADRRRTLRAKATGYCVFTTAYDEQRDAETGLRRELLREYREQLDRYEASHALNAGRLARKLSTLCTETAAAGWESGHEAGHVDGRLLSRLVSSPGERRVFRIEEHAPLPSLDITLLVDCSGSMKRHAEAVAALVDVLARACDRADTVCEILGFTTGAWNGGRAYRDWMRAGRPANPGRLNEIRHLVFKQADAPWKTTRQRIAVLLHQEMYREGLDGEAVGWASARAIARDATRRVLFVISDGSPMDSATAITNGQQYIDEHLKEVVTSIEQHAAIEIIGLGVGMDLRPYYRRSQILDLSLGTRNATLDETIDLLRPRRR